MKTTECINDGYLDIHAAGGGIDEGYLEKPTNEGVSEGGAGA